MHHTRLALLLGISLGPAVLAAQAAMDPAVAPRAVALDRAGRRNEATEMLGRYLATAPDDAGAWLELGRFYLLDSRAWHLQGHRGDPADALYLDFAATALDQSLRRPSDSALVLRAMIEMDRARGVLEQQGWSAVADRPGASRAADLPPYLLELGANLIGSCPARGVLVTGSDLEAVAVWAADVTSPRPSTVVALDLDLYARDSLYRSRLAAALEASPQRPLAELLPWLARERPVCLSPAADTASIQAQPHHVVRLVMVSGPSAPLDPAGLSVVELQSADLARPSGLTDQTRRLYWLAARRNRLLCTSLALQLGVPGRTTCSAP
jgi:hypothetical protein